MAYEKPIDWDKVDKMLEADCSGREIAAYFCIHPDTLYNRAAERYEQPFSEYSHKMKLKGDTLIRQKQLDKAMDAAGDNTMLIWLGKQRLDQRDKPKEDQGVDVANLAQVLKLLSEQLIKQE